MRNVGSPQKSIEDSIGRLECIETGGERRKGEAMAFEKEMQVLVDAEKNRKPIGPVSDMVAGGLSLDDAYRICERII